MTSWLLGFCDRAFAVLGALFLAQTPMYMQQYSHQLSGRVAELQLQVNAMANSAFMGGKSLDQYIKRFLDSGDPDFYRQGQLMQAMKERFESLSYALETIHNASPFAKPFLFIRHFDGDMARQVFANFQPGIPVNLEGLIYALMGILLGFTFFSLIKMTFNFTWKLLKRPFKRSNEEMANGMPECKTP